MATSKRCPVMYYFPILVLSGAFVLNACKDVSTSADQSSQQETTPLAVQGEAPIATDSAAVRRSDDLFKRRANKHFVHLAEQIPAFGGIYLKDKATRLVIGLKQLEQADNPGVEQIARNYLANQAPVVGSRVPGGVQALKRPNIYTPS